MATGSEKGVEAAGGPAACYRELSRFPAVTRAALRAAAGGQTFLLYTECSRPDLARRQLLRFGRHYSLQRAAGPEGLAVSRTALSAEIHNQYGTGGLQDGTLCPWHGQCLWSSQGPTARPVPTPLRPPQPRSLPPSGSSAGTRPQGSAEPCSAAAPGRATSCWRCGTTGDAAIAWISRPWGSTGRSTRRVGPLPHDLCLQQGEPWCLPGAHLCLCQAGLWHPHAMPGPFACLAWSHSETQLLYVAEKNRPKQQPPCPWDVQGAAWPAAEDEEGKQFVYHEDWGEALSTCSVPILCVLDLVGLSLSVLEGVPEHLSPGQALWSPDDCGVVFVGWWHEPFRLGLNACSNRRSGIFHLDLASGCCELLSAENGSACSPRLSPDGQHLLYLEGVVGGPHRQCLRLRMLTWQTRQTVTVLDVVQEPTEAFAGLYAEVLPLCCWAADSRRAVLGTPQRSRTDLLLVDVEAATVINLTAGSPEGCWELLTLQWDVLVATCSAPNHPPSLVVALLPSAGQELHLSWVPVEDIPTVPGVTWKTLMVQPPCSGQGPAARDTQAFEALLLSPSDGTPPHPLIVCPHGGPHAVFDARWRPSMAALCQLGFAVLLVNYRGSLGFGQASISSLLSRVGEQDVADTQLAVEQALRREPLDPHRLALLAGSHGAFIALHLLTREPKRYQACALRSPVSNLPALLGTSDIPDWRYISLGLPYSFERVPRAEEVATMLLRSPIAQAAQVRQGQDGCGVPGVGCQAPTKGSAAGADAGVAVCGRPGPACQPHTVAGAVPGAAGQGCASTAAVVPGGQPRTDRCGDGGRCLQELCPLAPPAPGAAQAGCDKPAQPLVPAVVLGYASPRVTTGPGDHTRARSRWSECSQGQVGLWVGV